MRILSIEGGWTSGVVALALAATFVVTGCSADGATGQQVEAVAEQDLALEIDVTSQSRVSLRATEGTIWIRGVAESDTVSIAGVRRVSCTSKASATAHLPDIEVQSSVSTDAVGIETYHPEPLPRFRYSVDYDVTVPQDMEVEIESANGDVYAVAVHSSIAVTVGEGNVTLWDVQGNASVHIDKGDLAAFVTLPDQGTLDFSVGEGHIGLDIPQDTSAWFYAMAQRGVISVADLEVAYLDAEPNTYFNGKLGQGDGAMALQADDGDITLSGYFNPEAEPSFRSQ